MPALCILGPLQLRGPATAGKLLREALELWRGPALADVADGLPLLRPRIEALEEARLTALERRVRADLAVGRHRDLIAELTSAYPLSEQLRAHQMVALYRGGRQADALAVFHRLRGQLDAELGIYPGPDLGRLYEAILRADPSLGSAVSGGAAGSLAAAPSASSALAVPRQLPARVAGFTGRSEPLRDLDARAAARDQSVVITAITGAPGVGKSALAVSWAHSVQAQFPDGTFFANLRGYDPAGIPAEPGEVLQGFLRALPVPADAIPAGDDERAALLRTSLDRKRALIILDNAASPQQVRPLLPGSAGCAVVVTSRSRLSGLVARDGATRITLAPLPDVEAVALLRETVGSKRVEAEPEAVDEVVRLCGGLPLALRIAADHAAGSGSLQLAKLAGQLTDERNRLQVLTTDDDDDDTAVRAAFSWSYRGLPAEAARAFRLLGLHPGAECSLPAAAALVGPMSRPWHSTTSARHTRNWGATARPSTTCVKRSRSSGRPAICTTRR